MRLLLFSASLTYWKDITTMRIHFIAIGGSAMHNLALALHDIGHEITGSDDEIYEPSKSRLAQAGLLPDQYGWHSEKITPNLDAIILGMHATKDNPELLRAQALNIPVYSYPEFVANHAKNKLRVVVAGSHGKTTTTSMIMHVLSKQGMDYDYLVGAQLKGFDRMVKLSDAPVIILEGDEYLSSPIDRRPKMLHYQPQVAVITGVSWDHINVFPTEEDYVDQFRLFVKGLDHDAVVYYFTQDSHLTNIANEVNGVDMRPYSSVAHDKGEVVVDGRRYPLSVIGRHNMQNIEAARLVCQELGVEGHDFFRAIGDFEGAHKRLQPLRPASSTSGPVYLDFAHAPSKVMATTSAVKEWYDDRELVAVLELHTYSSLNKDFLPQYKSALDFADRAYVYYSAHAMKIKNMPPLDPSQVAAAFDHDHLEVISDKSEMHQLISSLLEGNQTTLLMSSGTFDGYDF